MAISTGYGHEIFIRDARRRNETHERLIAHFGNCFPGSPYEVLATLARLRAQSEELRGQMESMARVARRFTPRR
jgi:hypothetical protein